MCQAAELVGYLSYFSTSTRRGRFLYIALKHSVYKARFNSKFIFQNEIFKTFTNMLTH